MLTITLSIMPSFVRWPYFVNMIDSSSKNNLGLREKIHFSGKYMV